MESMELFRKNLESLMGFHQISVEQLSHKINISYEKLSNWIKGADNPTYNQILRIADCMKRPIIYFFLEEPPVQSFEIDFRKAERFDQVIDKKRLAELVDSLVIYKSSIKEVFNDVNNECKLHEWISHSEDLDFNNYLRKELDFSIQTQCQFKRATEVVEYLREKFYRCGIFIFKDSFRLEDVSGICAYDETYPIILINNKVSFTRQLFTIFHELYHLLSRASHIDFLNIDERDCDNFAGQFLIPSSCLLRDIQKHRIQPGVNNCEDDEFIKDRADHYNVSRVAYLYQLLKRGEVSQEYYISYEQRNRQYLIRSRQDDIVGGNYYYTKMNYLGKSYLSDIVSGYFAGKISIHQVAQYTQMKAPSAKKMLTMMAGGRY